MDHESGYFELRETFGPAPTCVDGGELTWRSLGIEGAVEVASRLDLDAIGVEVTARLPDGVLDRFLDVGRAFGGRRRQQHRGRLGKGLSVFGFTGDRHDGGERNDPRAMFDRNVLRDHPAHRCSDDVSLVDAEMIEQSDRVERHVGQRVRNWWHRKIGEGGRHDRVDIDAHAVKFRRQATITIVEPDDVKTSIDQSGTETVGPADHLGHETHHQKNRRMTQIAQLFVFEFDGSDVGGNDDARHPTTITHSPTLH